MDSPNLAAIRSKFEGKTSDELLNIYREHDDDEWSVETFEAIRQILGARSVPIPSVAKKPKRPPQHEVRFPASFLLSNKIAGTGSVMFVDEYAELTGEVPWLQDASNSKLRFLVALGVVVLWLGVLGWGIAYLFCRSRRTFRIAPRDVRECRRLSDTEVGLTFVDGRGGPVTTKMAGDAVVVGELVAGFEQLKRH